MNEDNKIKYGWICPVCGAVMSPEQRTCVFCTLNKNVTIHSIPYVNVDYAKTISVTESNYKNQEDKK